jgi:alanine-synthesizing transaminase
MRFSRRVAPSVRPTAWSTRVEHARAAGAIDADLTVSNPTSAGLGTMDPATLAALSDSGSLRYAPSAQGLASARESVSAHYRDAHGVTVDPGRVWLAASTSELYAQLFMLHCDRGDEVLVPRPSYPLFDALARLVGARVRRFSLRYEGEWMVDLQSLADGITARTRAVVLVSPNNPTGSRIRAHELSFITALCAARGVALLVDEVFAEYPLDPVDGAAGTTACEGGALCWTLGGLSKSAGLPQMKLGWAVLSGPEPWVSLAHERFAHVADAFLSAGAPVQHAAGVFLAHGVRARREITTRTRENLRAARELLGPETGVRTLGCEGGWSAVLRVPRVRSERAWARELLARDRVLVQPGYLYDFEGDGHLVVSLLPEPTLFREGIARIAARGACWLRE